MTPTNKQDLWFTIVVVIVFIIMMIVWPDDVQACSDHKAKIFAEITLGSNNNSTGESVPWDDGNGIGTFLSFGYQGKPVRWIYGEPLPIASYKHGSQIDVGPPFNNDKESSVDHFGLGLKWEWEL